MTKLEKLTALLVNEIKQAKIYPNWAVVVFIVSVVFGITSILNKKIDSGKAIILIGPRQVGKTTLIKSVLEDKDYLFLDGDDPTVRNILTNPNTEQLKSIIGNYKIVFIDEAQRIENIGITLKIITDQFKSVQLFVSGTGF